MTGLSYKTAAHSNLFRVHTLLWEDHIKVLLEKYQGGGGGG